jgi:DNA-binding transcriptional ArsR family regulator
MFARWNLARNPFDPNPISLATLDWFVGRRREVQLCQRLVAEGSVVVVEGGLGVGTTSFANVVRFESGKRTPKMELAVYRGWTAQTLLENVLVAVIHELSEDPRAKTLPAVRRVQSLVQRVEKAVHSAGVSLLGFGGQVSRNVSVTQPGIVPMETLRQSLTALAKALAPKSGGNTGGATFVIQLNNLDPDLTFTGDELSTFLNDIRDSLQLPGFGWLLVGKMGLGRFITVNVPRLRSIVAHDVAVAPLSKDQMKKVIKRRIEACAVPGQKPTNPLDQELLEEIYDASGGSLRETFNVCTKLCVALAPDPLYVKITKKEAGALLAELLSVRFASIQRSPLQRAILLELAARPGMTQQELIKRLGKTQAAISRASKTLIETELVRRTKEGRQVRYWPAPEVRLAARHL